MSRFWLPICVALFTYPANGCGPSTIDMSAKLRAAHLPDLAAPEHGIRFNETTKNIELSKHPHFDAAPRVVDGLTVVPYVRLLWLFMKMPVIVGRGPDGRRALILFDTGLTPEFLRVTADTAIRAKMPSRTAPPAIAKVDSLELARGMTLRDVPALIQTTQWQLRAFGLPIYRLSGFVLGLPPMRSFAAIAFDNERQQVVLAPKQPFAPGDTRQWHSYPMRMGKHELLATIPIAGQDVALIPDTGGGPTMILSADDWQRIEPHVTVRRRTRGRYPSWDSFVAIDIYQLAELRVANQRLRGPTVWVRRDPRPEYVALQSTVGLGSFRRTVVVYDFAHMKLWVKRTDLPPTDPPWPAS